MVMDAGVATVGNNPVADKPEFGFNPDEGHTVVVPIPSAGITELVLPVCLDNISHWEDDLLEGYGRFFREYNLLALDAECLRVETTESQFLMLTSVRVDFRDMVTGTHTEWMMAVADLEDVTSHAGKMQPYADQCAGELQKLRIPKIAEIIATIDNEMRKRTDERSSRQA